MDPYQVLGVTKTASIEEIKAAYRRIAKTTHPDLHGPAGVATFRQATDAYAILTEPTQRASYDATGSFDEHHVTAAREDIFDAIEYLRNLTSDAKAEARSAAVKGLLWLGGGATITAIGYQSASSGGGTYPVFWGAILFGGLQALRGLSAYTQIDSKARRIERDIWLTVTGVPIR